MPGWDNRLRCWWGWLSALLVMFSLAACSAPFPTGGEPTVAPAAHNPATSTAASTSTQLPSPSQPAVTATQASAPLSTSTPTSQPSATSTAPALVFAAIGDYGGANQEEAEVADLVKSWNPAFILTLGDNNYPNGSADQIDAAVGQFFHSFIYPYKGSYGEGAQVNRFFPTLGNHDVQTQGGQPYFDYFSLPGNERYYDFTWGPLHLYAIDDLDSEPDGFRADSVQAAWLQQKLAGSTSPWNIVYMHYPPYSSGKHASTTYARWPYAEWGADAVLAGHDHTYERLVEDGVTYIVNGLGGYGRYEFVNIVEGSLFRYNAEYGALRIEATDHSLQFQFFNLRDELIDQVILRK